MIASAWIDEARAQQANLGLINDEMEKWKQIIEDDLAEVNPPRPAKRTLPIRLASPRNHDDHHEREHDSS